VFLTSFVDDAWKDEHIATWVSYSGTMGGVQESLAIQLASGSIFPIPTMSSSQALTTYRCAFRRWAPHCMACVARLTLLLYDIGRGHP
jgi:hypothetical protein